MATITAGDYTVELQIQPKSFKAWYENVYLPKDYKNEVPSSLSLKKHLISILEEQLTLKMENARRSEAF
jgi:regulator of replication initiation timing